MLDCSFIHAKGVGPATERALWRSGARDWNAFLHLHKAGHLVGGRMDRIARLVEESQEALRSGAVEFFGERLPRGELWRLHPHFGSRAAYFDIETTGLSPGTDVVTVVGLYDGERFQGFVRGQNLEDF